MEKSCRVFEDAYVRKNWVLAAAAPPPLNTPLPIRRPRGVPHGIWTLIMPLLKEKSAALKCLRHDRFLFLFFFISMFPTLFLSLFPSNLAF